LIQHEKAICDSQASHTWGCLAGFAGFRKVSLWSDSVICLGWTDSANLGSQPLPALRRFALHRVAAPL
jgi:hypothetical protein